MTLIKRLIFGASATKAQGGVFYQGIHGRYVAGAVLLYLCEDGADFDYIEQVLSMWFAL